MTDKRILIIGLVWPEPTSSAAGTRMIQLVTLFIYEGYTVFFASAASKSEFSFQLTEIGVTELPIKLNDSSFDRLIAEISPSIVLFDRFMIEEQYGWRVTETCPDALKILDTEDLHFLRHDRKYALNNNSDSNPLSEIAKREIASILRCDLSLIISEHELELLQNHYRIDPALLYYLPFLENRIQKEQISAWRSFEDRAGFVFIGNFLHEPNWHTTQFLKTKIWPELRRKNPDASMHIYGAYTSQKVIQLHNPKERFYVHGRADHAQETIQQHRVLLAPIQFGAGVKGKFIDAMQTGTPSVTTNIGAESMSGNLAWPGVIENDPQKFIDSAAKLYNDKGLWLQSQQNGIRIINERYDSELFSKTFMLAIDTLFNKLGSHRAQNVLGQILKMNTLNSSKYMALWIEEKNKKT